MKHLLNNLTQEEKNNILEQHDGGMKVMTENFRKLMGAKHGNVKPLVEQGNTQLSLSQGLKSTINGASKDLNGVKTICDFCKRSNVKQQSNTPQLITKVNQLLSGIENPANLLGGGSVTKVAELIRTQVKTPEQACALIKFYQNQKSLVGLSFGGDDEDFYEAIHDDLVTKMNTTGPSEELINAIDATTSPLVKEQEEENYDEARKDYNWFERDDIAPEDLEKVLSNNNKKYSDKEWKLNDLKKRFTSPILNANSEEEIMDAIMNMAELASYRKTQPFVNEQSRSVDNEYYSDNSLSKPGRVYLKNGDKDEVDEILSNLPTDTLFLALLDCEEADFSNIDLGEFKSLLFINLKGTPNNLLRTQGDYFEHDKKGFYMTTKNI
jgi:hypothetical protein